MSAKEKPMNKRWKLTLVAILLAIALLAATSKAKGTPIYLPALEAYPIPAAAYPEPTWISTVNPVVATIRAVQPPRTPFPVIRERP